MHELTKLLPLLSLAVVVAVVAAVRRSPTLGWLIIAGLVISSGDWPNPAALTHLGGGLAIYPLDAAGIVFLLAALTTPGAFRHAEPADLVIWGAVAGTVVASVLRGFSEFGLATAGNEARGIFQLAAATLWVWVRMPRPTFLRELNLWCWVTGIGLTVDALVHIAQRGLGSVDQRILVNGDLVTSRPLVSSQALVLGLIGLAILGRSSRASVRVLAGGFFVLAVACQHRSVWAAFIVAVASLVLLAPRLRARLLGLGLLTGFVLLVLYAAGTLDPVIARFDEAIHSRGTLIDRQFAWRTLVTQQNRMGTTSVLTGQPFGAGFARRVPGGGVELFAPHNYYVSLYLRIGLIGAAAFALGLLRGALRNVRFRQPIELAWGVGLMTYCFAYNIQLYVAPLLAVGLGVRLSSAARGKHVQPVDPDAEAARAALVPVS
jgi:hypothetical protein